MRWAFSSRPAWSEPRCTRMALILSAGPESVCIDERAGVVQEFRRGREDRLAPEAVDLPEVAPRGHRAALLGNQRRQVLALVAERVVLCGRDQRRWQRPQPV